MREGLWRADVVKCFGIVVLGEGVCDGGEGDIADGFAFHIYHLGADAGISGHGDEFCESGQHWLADFAAVTACGVKESRDGGLTVRESFARNLWAGEFQRAAEWVSVGANHLWRVESLGEQCSEHEHD